MQQWTLEDKDSRKLERNLKLFKKNIRRRVILNGLDSDYRQSVQELKSQLKSLLNNRVRVEDKEGNLLMLDDPLSEEVKAKGGPNQISKAKNDVIKEIFGIDTQKEKPSNDWYTTSEEKPIFVIKKVYNKKTEQYQKIVKYRKHTSPYSSYEQEFASVSKAVNEGIFIDEETGEIFASDENVDVRPECSNEPGDSDKSKETFESRQESRGQTGIGDYLTWSLFEDSIEDIRKNAIKANEIAEDVLEGKTEEAIEKVKNKKRNNAQSNKTLEKLNDIKEKRNISPELESHTKIMELINNVRPGKRAKPGITVYTLITNYANSEEVKPFIPEIRSQISAWIGTNQKRWVQTIVQQIVKTARMAFRS